MKRLVFVLSSLLVLPAFAEVAPSSYDVEPMSPDAVYDDAWEMENVVEEATDEVETVKPQQSGRTNARASVTRTTPTRSLRGTAPRTNSVRNRNISIRGTANPIRTTSVSTRSVAARPGIAARASVVGSANTASSLYNANQQRRVTSVGSVRGATVRATTGTVAAASTTTTPTAETAVETTAELNTMKSLTEYCQAQYASCMDNYCNVLDDNQGRCTCSKNINGYQKTETALANATEALQEVARSIQYIGLPADQISTLFAETEAELTMKDSGSKDNSAIRSSLDKIKRMIVDVKSGTASATESDAVNFDLSGLLNFNVDSVGFDLSAFTNLGGSSTNSISNQRGESLYKTAVARCKASVLNSCVAKGVDAAVVTNSYDLEIDKSCLAYERALTESNKQMTQTVANAREVLKKARLMVAQTKNSYDLRGCVSALESCMQDDYVCGNGYANCMDPTGQYIVNGAVVVGSMPGNNTGTGDTVSTTYSHDNLFSTWNVGTGTSTKNPWSTKKATGTQTSCSGSEAAPCAMTLVQYVDDTVTSDAAKASSTQMSAFLQNKIGYHDDKANKDYGMCMSVLNKCQDYTYTSKGSKKTYNPENEVIKQFLQRSLVQIKMSQDELLTSYAENCMSDVSSCLSSNNYDAAIPKSLKSRTAINSCYAQIKTCMSVTGNIFGAVDSNVMETWVTGNYTSLTTYRTQNEIQTYCRSLTTQEDCEAAKGYLVTDDAPTTWTLKDPMCTWNNNATTNKCQDN